MGWGLSKIYSEFWQFASAREGFSLDRSMTHLAILSDGNIKWRYTMLILICTNFLQLVGLLKTMPLSYYHLCCLLSRPTLGSFVIYDSIASLRRLFRSVWGRATAHAKPLIRLR